MATKDPQVSAGEGPSVADVEKQDVMDVVDVVENKGHDDGTRTRKDRATGSTHFGDVDFDDEDADQIGDASWKEVCTSCCCHTPKEWGMICAGIVLICFFLYFFLLGLELLGTSAKVLGGCTAGALFGDDTNPIAGLMIGILATVLLQSSSTTTSIIVSLVGSGAISVEPAIYMVMGANIGTSVTNTIVAMGQMGDGGQLERAFSGATVHDMFNYLSVAILLPVEAATHYLAALTGAIVRNMDDPEKGKKWEGPIKKIISPLGKKIIIANKSVINDIANKKVENCGQYYPVYCDDGIEDYKHCVKQGRVGLITCDKKTGDCPAFFQNGASEGDDKASGGVCLFLGLLILVICLIGLVSILQRMLMGTSTRIIYKATNINGYIAMLIGAGLTILVQSSSITTSVLTPLVGMGVIQLEQMFPLTLGANIGTTVTALMASLVSDKIEALQVALAHLFFNITGIIIWYPLPFMRRVPLRAARTLGKATRWWRLFPVLYIAVMFFILPLVFLGISYLFTMGSTGFTVLGAILVCLIGLGIIYFVYWWHWKKGKEAMQLCFAKRQRRRDVMKELPSDMEYLKTEIARLKEHTCLPDAEEDAEEGAVNKLKDNEDESHDTSEE